MVFTLFTPGPGVCRGKHENGIKQRGRAHFHTQPRAPKWEQAAQSRRAIGSLRNKGAAFFAFFLIRGFMPLSLRAPNQRPNGFCLFVSAKERRNPFKVDQKTVFISLSTNDAFSALFFFACPKKNPERAPAQCSQLPHSHGTGGQPIARLRIGGMLLFPSEQHLFGSTFSGYRKTSWT